MLLFKYSNMKIHDVSGSKHVEHSELNEFSPNSYIAHVESLIPSVMFFGSEALRGNSV